MTDRLLTAREVAERLGVSAETVLRWTRRGELPAIRLPGGAIRYREGDLDARLDAWQVGTTNREGATHHDGRARVGGYATTVRSNVRPITPPDGGVNREGGPPHAC